MSVEDMLGTAIVEFDGSDGSVLAIGYQRDFDRGLLRYQARVRIEENDMEASVRASLENIEERMRKFGLAVVFMPSVEWMLRLRNMTSPLCEPQH